VAAESGWIRNAEQAFACFVNTQAGHVPPSCPP